MELNVDLLLAGCDTECRHCYVNGGPGRLMPLEDALLCLQRLDEIAALLPFPASFTLDNEPIKHPEIAAILRSATGLKHIEHYHHGMTTGLALLRRPDREAVVKSYLDCGCVSFGVTLHGDAAHHDEIVRRKGAFRASLEAAAFLKSCGAELNVSLLLNRFFREDAAALDRVIRELKPSFIYFAVPNYTPHARMMGFEDYRARLSDLIALSPLLRDWGQDAEALLAQAEQSTPGAAAERLERGLDLQALFRQDQQELYCTVHQDRQLYLGNTGAETALLGDLRTLDPALAAERLSREPGNRDYTAFYDPDTLPEAGTLAGALRRLPADRLYSDEASVLYRGLAALGVPTRILAL